eukprot:SM000314S12189  [mRNA]  locus=s314:109754:113730:- [translate_table: standard]
MDSSDEEAYERLSGVSAVPPAGLVRRLASAISVARTVASMKDLGLLKQEAADAVRSIRWSGLVSSLAALRSRSTTVARSEDKAPQRSALLRAVFRSGATACTAPQEHVSGAEKELTKCDLLREIHAAPLNSFVAQLAEVMGGISSEQEMASLWLAVVAELRRHWVEGRPIPGVEVEEDPDLRSCLLHQQLQLINCCIARRKRRATSLAALQKVDLDDSHSHSHSHNESSAGKSLTEAGRIFGPLKEPNGCNGSAWADAMFFSGYLIGKLITPLTAVHLFDDKCAYVDANSQVGVAEEVLYARLADDQLMRRLAVQKPVPHLRLLETGEQCYAPVCQDLPVLTEVLIRENEELVLRTGSVGAGCQQLFGDMQAFKAANPGCILEDFVRWYSPLDWRETPRSPGGMVAGSSASDVSCAIKVHGYLSVRMQSEARDLRGVTTGNLWQELWASAKAIPAARQPPLFDEELSGESTLDFLEKIAPSDLFEQLFVVALGAGMALAEASALPGKEPLASCLEECLAYVVQTCTQGMGSSKLEKLCQVYETMETAFLSTIEGESTTLDPSGHPEAFCNAQAADTSWGPISKGHVADAVDGTVESRSFPEKSASEWGSQAEAMRSRAGKALASMTSLEAIKAIPRTSSDRVPIVDNWMAI